MQDTSTSSEKSLPKPLPQYSLHLETPDEKNADWFKRLYKLQKFGWATPYAAPSSFYTASMLRDYGRGMQSSDTYRQQFDPQGANSTTVAEIGQYSGLRFQNIISIIQQKKAVIMAEANALPNQIDANAISPLARNEKQQAKELLLIQKDMDRDLAFASARMGLMKPMKSDFSKQALGQSTLASNAIHLDVEDESEADVYMETHYKPRVCRAAELTFDALANVLNWDEIKKALLHDALDYGRSAHRVFMSPVTGMPDIECLDSPLLELGTHKLEDASDSESWRYPYRWTIGHAANHLKMTMEEARDLFKRANIASGMFMDARGQYYNTTNYNFNTYIPTSDDFERVYVNFFYAEVKSTDIYTYEAKQWDDGDIKTLRKKKADYEPPPYSKKKTRESRQCRTVYKGYYCPITDTVYGFGKLENQIREKGKEQYPPFSLVYRLYSHRSFVSQLLPIADQIQLNFLKLEQCVLKALPPGYAIDMDAMASLDLGQAGKWEDRELLRMFLQTGTIIVKHVKEDGTAVMPNGGSPIEHLKNGLDPNIGLYWNNIQNLIMLADSITGINRVVSGEAAQPRTNEMSLQLAAQGAQKSIYNIISGFNKLTADTANQLLIYVQDLSKSKGSGWEAIKNMVGAINADIVESMDDLHLHQLGIKTRQKMSDGERSELKQLLIQAYGKGDVDWDTVTIAWFTEDYQTALALVNIRRRKMMKMRAQEMQMQQQQFAAQQQAQLQGKVAPAQIMAQSNQQVAQINQQGNLQATAIDAQEKARREEAGAFFKEQHIRADGEEKRKVEQQKQIGNLTQAA